MRKHLKFMALLLLAALILWWFGRKLDWAEVWMAVSRADWRLLVVAVALVCSTYMLRAFRWRTLLAPLTPSSLSALFVATTIGFSSVMLFGRAGEVVRPVVLPLRDRRVRPAASFITIIIERVCDTVAVLVLFALSLIWIPALRYVRVAGPILLIVSLTGLVVLALFERRSRAVIGWFKRRVERRRFVPQRLSKGVIHLLEQLASALRVLADARELAITAGWTALLWLTITLANWLVLRAFGVSIGGSAIGLTGAMYVMGWELLGSLVPTPGGGAGAFHTAAAVGLIFLGVSRNDAAAIAFIAHLVLFAPALIFGIYYFLRGDIDIGRLRRLTSSDAVEHAVEGERVESAEAAAFGTVLAGK